MKQNSKAIKPKTLAPKHRCSLSLTHQMKKKKQKSAEPPPTAAAAAATTSAAADLKALIREHSLFFDKLIELIPAKFYLPSDDAKPWFQGLKKSAREAAKQQTRENIKKARRDRLDPEKSQTSTLELLKKSIEIGKEPNKSEADKDEDEQDGGDGDRSVTYEELRQRLHRRIEDLRSNRGNGERSKFEEREPTEEERGVVKWKRRVSDGNVGKIGKSEDEIEKDVTEATKGIEFGKVKLGRGG
ncbi:hypothetical protein LOK49_LG01G00494 [Camellia lanceoleosa]|uniref:Uncharacterized protein n=1 Tax=Camellia lanceoleosa TaxID=1840588 RepID=A0ACC0IUB8_9ERIC|nr:hypothetical protein LOK49_LG01G00494 [Camellia lanceoleosa]